MKRRTFAFTLLAMVLLISALAGITLADPSEIKLTTWDDWLQADIEPVTEWNEGLQGLHPDQWEAYRPPDLYVIEKLVDEAGNSLDPAPGLVMSWGTPADEGEIIAAWELILPEDPDFTNYCVSLAAWPRSGMTSISFSLKDVNNVMKGWRWPVGASPGDLPPDVATTLLVRASAGAGEDGSTLFWDGGIDLTKVVAFEFDESGVAQPPGIPLPNNLPGFVGQWNYWHDIVVYPCQMLIDIKPGSDPNGVNVRSKGLIPVAILTTFLADGDPFDFDAQAVDPSTVVFGPLQAPAAHKKAHIEDVDKDGDLDMLLHFETSLTGIACGDTQAELLVTTTVGLQFKGTDSIKTVGCK